MCRLYSQRVAQWNLLEALSCATTTKSCSASAAVAVAVSVAASVTASADVLSLNA